MPLFEGIDTASLSLILRLQNDDLQHVLQQEIPQTSAGLDPLSINRLETEYQIDSQHLADLVLARRIAAVKGDTDLNQQYTRYEELTRQHRELESHMHSGRRTVSLPLAVNQQQPDPTILERPALHSFETSQLTRAEPEESEDAIMQVLKITEEGRRHKPGCKTSRARRVQGKSRRNSSVHSLHEQRHQ